VLLGSIADWLTASGLGKLRMSHIMGGEPELYSALSMVYSFTWVYPFGLPRNYVHGTVIYFGSCLELLSQE